MTRMRQRSRTVVAVLAAVTLVLSGCGLKPAVMDAAGGAEGLNRGVGAGVGDGGLAVDPNTGEVIGDLPAGDVPGGSTADGSTGSTAGSGPGATAGGTKGSATQGPGGATAGPAASGPGDRTGVTDDSITLGLHAPVTGAAAFPSASFRNGVGVYADYINRKGGINGRKLNVLFEDDRFDPNTARQKCAKMAEQNKAFVLIGGGGSDQIDACARYSATKGVPYLSAGVHEQRPRIGSIATRTYFALSMSYEQQVPLLVNLIKSDHQGKKVALLVADNDSVTSFYDRANAALKSAFGSNLVLSRRIPKNTDARDAPGIAREICASGAGVVVWNAAPTGLIAVSKSTGCSVRWIGPGNTNGLNIVATGGCPHIDKAQFFATIPGIDDADKVDPNFRASYRRLRGGEPDDIALLLWGVEKLVATMLQKAGKNLTREGFMASVPGSTFTTAVMPTTRYSGNNRFGGTAMHLLQADCQLRDSKYKTYRMNVRP